ncbi:flagellar biosynthetic protein FliP, partial [Bacillus sp. SIMBA_161]
VLSFVRTGLGTQSMPPNQVLVGLALFLTFFIMAPIATEINDTALQPYLDEELAQEEALDAAILPIKEFMAQHTREKDLALFFKYAELEKPE